MIARFLRPLAACILLLTAFTPFACARPGDARPSVPGDPLLQAMSTEMARSKSALKLDQVAAPYYIEYRVFDVDVFNASASFGALQANVRTRLRLLRVVVRIGDYKQDSYYGEGTGSFDVMPLDDDSIALRHQLWEATDRAYKAAAESLTAKQSQLKRLAPPDHPVDDFARAEPLQSIGPLAKLDYDALPSTAMLQEASAIYKDDPRIEFASSSLSFQAVNRYYVNSEGAVVRSGQTLYTMDIAFSTQAADGMRLERSNGFAFASSRDLPSTAEFTSRARQLVGTLKELRDAPLVDEEYRGPVLFSADAASSAFADLIGENVLGRAPDLGQNGRTTGEFAASYKSRVLPDFLSVVDNPTIASYQGQPLLGQYAIDDEGVPAQIVSVIDRGVLANYLVGRTPIRDFPASNGHGRARIPTNPPGASLGNLLVTASQSSSPAELKKKLADLCRQRSLPYGYFVETFGPRLVPRLLYRIYAADGHQELVRGSTFGDLDTRAMRSDIIAAGNDVHVENLPLAIPHSIVAPSILFDELEVKRATTDKDKLPDYPVPPLVPAK